MYIAKAMALGRVYDFITTQITITKNCHILNIYFLNKIFIRIYLLYRGISSNNSD
jgi:hypothetical protein